MRREPGRARCPAWPRQGTHGPLRVGAMGTRLGGFQETGEREFGCPRGEIRQLADAAINIQELRQES